MDLIEEKMRAIQWEYADKDLGALGALRERIEQTGRKNGLISYTDLVTGIPFHYPNINHGAPHYIQVFGEWTGLDRRIIGNCLAYISMESYIEAGFMASALVVARLEAKPSEMFFQWMEELGALPDLSEYAVLKFWTEQVRRAHQWYRYGKKI